MLISRDTASEQSVEWAHSFKSTIRIFTNFNLFLKKSRIFTNFKIESHELSNYEVMSVGVKI